MQHSAGYQWKEVILAAAAAAFFFQAGFMAVLFLVPLQSLLFRRGENNYLAAAGMMLLLLTALRAAGGTAGNSSYAAAGLGLDLSFALLAMACLYLLQPRFFAGRRRILVLGVLMGGFLLLTYPVLHQLMYRTDVEQAAEAYIQPFVEMVQDGIADTRSDVPGVDAADLFRLMRQGILSSYAGVFFLIVLTGWWGGTVWAERRGNSSARHYSRPEDFFLPDGGIWVFLIPLTVLVIQKMLALNQYPQLPGSVENLSLNIIYIMGILFAVTGVGVIRYWLRGDRGKALRRFVPYILLGLIFLWPLNLIILSAVPLLGLTDHWFQFRINKGENGNETDSE